MATSGTTMVTLAMITIISVLSLSEAINIGQVRRIAAKYNVTCVLVFGDSSVDSGNNNYLNTTIKANYLPYGRDFLGGHPTGRFTNGRLATDFISEALGYAEAVPAFLNPKLRSKEILHGVSFASADSGYDDLTSNLNGVLSLSKQIDYYLRQYKLRLARFVGVRKTQVIINNAVAVLSMGTNDFLQNYYLEPIRPKQYTLEEYQNYLVSCMFTGIKKMHGIGIRRLVVVGVPPLGCMPLVKTLNGLDTCVEKYNNFSATFNAKIKAKLATTKTRLGVLSAYVDAFGLMQDAVNNPKLYGLKETSKGCVGTGTTEMGESCRGVPTCSDASGYVFWDAVHPTERMYKIIADGAIKSISHDLLK